MITFPLNENRFSFLLQTIYLLADCVQIPRVKGAIYHVWKWHNGQRVRSEMRCCTTHALYRSKLWQQDHCQHPQNANPDGSTLEGTAHGIGWPFGGGGVEGHRQEDPNQGVHRKGPCNHGWNSPAAYAADCQRLSSHTTVNACMKDLKCRSYRHQTSQMLTKKTRNLRLIKSIRPPPPPTWTCWTTSFGHTSRISPKWSPTSPNPAWSPPSAEYSPSSRWHLWKRHARSFGSVSRRWLRLKAATLNRCQLYYIINLPELIFLIKILK